MDWTLERVNVPKSFIVLDNNEESYRCGRSADSEIICPSLVVSREHCIFLRVGEEIAVIDLKSSNGVFVNNQLIASKTLVKLRENDIIGLGCNELYRDDEPMFVYKLHKGNLSSRNLANFDDLSTQKLATTTAPAPLPSASPSPLVEVIAENNPKESESELPSNKNNARSAPKRNLYTKNAKDDRNSYIPPSKITRLGEKNEHLSDNNANILLKDKTKDDAESSKNVERIGGEEEEIQEIWSIIYSPKSDKNESITTPVSPVIKTSEKSLQDKRSNCLTLDLKVEKKEEEEEREDAKDENTTAINLTESKDIVAKKMKELSRNEKKKKETKTVEKIKDRRESEARKRQKEKGNKRSEKTLEMEQTTKQIVNNSQRTLHFSVDTNLSTTRLTLNISDPNISTVEESIDTRVDGKKTGKKKSTEDHSTKKVKTDNTLKKNERNSFFDKTPTATSSPFKLKFIKQEPTTSFSIVDTVDLSDDEEDIFPSSQLFDSMTMSTSMTNNGDVIKTEEDDIEMKEENIFDNYQLNEEEEEKDPIDDCKDIIVLSDSEDEDNPWLIRLSESQRIKEEEPEKPFVKCESPEMEFVDEMIQVKKDLFDITDEDNREFITSTLSSIPISTTKNDIAKNEKQSSSSKRLSISKIGREIINDENDDYDDDKDLEDFTDAAAQVLTSPSVIADHQSPTAVIKSQQQQQQPTLSKGPKIIEPLHLPQKKRRSLEDRISEIDSASTSSGLGFKDCLIRVSKLPTDLTVKEKRLLQLEDKRKEKEYENQQRLRRVKNKWAQSVPLPLGKRKSLPITKKQKLEIVNERKEKLKALAQKRKQDAAGPSNVGRVAAKPKAKLSTKNRGDFLIDDTLQKKITEMTKTKQTTDKKDAKESCLRRNCNENQSPLLKLSETQENKKKNINKKVIKQTKETRERDKKSKGIETSLTMTMTMTTTTTTITTTSTIATTSMNSLNNDTKAVESRLKEMSLTQKENRVPNSFVEKEAKEKEKKRKKVTFRDDLTTVTEFQIEANNTLKKCIGKDALIPKDKLAPTRKIVNREAIPKIEEFLRHVFQWNPSWLDAQKHLESEPPVVGNGVLVPLLTNYKSYEDYYNVMTPLFLLELWHVITKEYEDIDKRYETLSCSIVANSMTFIKIPNSDTSLTTMMLEMVASDDDIKKQKHPANGDLVFLELRYRNNEEKIMFLKVFAYITYVHRSPITPKTFFNRDLINYVKKPSCVLTYTILTRPLKVNCCVNRVLRLRRVTCLRSNLRTIQALQSLPSSPLMNATVNPKIEQYQLAEPSNKKHSSLITSDKLNRKQLEAVFKITETIVRKEPKICLIQGPPGTGKSQVIVNMVMQTLYGDNRYKNRKTGLRILLCAPSNAAIDEIVLRLLDRRAKLPSDRFKMVRVGISNSMHPRVRDISVEELAKRDLKRVSAGFQSRLGHSMESVEEEKRYLEAKINALQSQLIGTRSTDDPQAQYLRTKLSDTRARYELIKNCIQSPGSNIDSKDIAKLQRGVESKILIHADIIACTLSSCYNNIMEASFGGGENGISVCIVDEATQCCEAETLIPLMLRVNTLVLVGDPAQLPATIISQKAKKLGLDQSLFSRIERAFESERNNPVITLDVQYRMDSEISQWPNKYFYRGKLRDANQRDNANNQRSTFPFRPYNVMNIDSVQNNDKFSNTSEAEFVVNLIQGMITHIQHKKITDNISIGVITPYRKQQVLVQKKMNERLSPILKNVQNKLTIHVNTIDSFQGHERDIIIMSCVRTKGIGFMSDRQRLCVALTRAKSCLVLCGNFATFQRDAMWGALLTDARSRNKYIKIKADAKPNEILSYLVVTR